MLFQELELLLHTPGPELLQCASSDEKYKVDLIQSQCRKTFTESRYTIHIGVRSQNTYFLKHISNTMHQCSISQKTIASKSRTQEPSVSFTCGAGSNGSEGRSKSTFFTGGALDSIPSFSGTAKPI